MIKMKLTEKQFQSIKETINKMEFKDIDTCHSYKKQGIFINNVLTDYETKIVTKYIDLILKVKFKIND